MKTIEIRADKPQTYSVFEYATERWGDYNLIGYGKIYATKATVFEMEEEEAKALGLAKDVNNRYLCIETKARAIWFRESCVHAFYTVKATIVNEKW